VGSFRSFGGMWEKEERLGLQRLRGRLWGGSGGVFRGFRPLLEVEEGELEFCAFIFGHWDACIFFG